MNTPSNSITRCNCWMSAGKGSPRDQVIRGTTFSLQRRIEPNGSGRESGQWVEVKGPLGFLGFMFRSERFGEVFGTLLRNLEEAEVSLARSLLEVLGSSSGCARTRRERLVCRLSLLG